LTDHVAIMLGMILFRVLSATRMSTIFGDALAQ